MSIFHFARFTEEPILFMFFIESVTNLSAFALIVSLGCCPVTLFELHAK